MCLPPQRPTRRQRRDCLVIGAYHHHPSLRPAAAAAAARSPQASATQRPWQAVRPSQEQAAPHGEQQQQAQQPPSLRPLARQLQHQLLAATTAAAATAQLMSRAAGAQHSPQCLSSRQAAPSLGSLLALPCPLHHRWRLPSALPLQQLTQSLSAQHPASSTAATSTSMRPCSG